MWQSHISDPKRFRRHPTSPTNNTYSFQVDIRRATSQSPLASPASTMSSTSSSNDTPKPEESSSGGFLSALSGMLKTPGVKNIEERFVSAGGTQHHTPGSATKLGSQDQKPNTHETTGVGSDHFHDRISDQRAEPTIVGKAFNNLINGHDKPK